MAQAEHGVAEQSVNSTQGVKGCGFSQTGLAIPKSSSEERLGPRTRKIGKHGLWLRTPARQPGPVLQDQGPFPAHRQYWPKNFYALRGYKDPYYWNPTVFTPGLPSEKDN